MMSTRGDSTSPFLTAVAWSSIAVIFALDCFTQLNIAILYALPLLLIGRILPTGKLLALTAALIAGAAFGYVIKSVVFAGQAPPLISYRLQNRVLAVIIIALTALVLRSLYNGRRDDGSGDDFDQLLASCRPVLMVLLGAVIAAAALTVDLLTPGQYNFAILYGLSVVLIAAGGSERLVWGTALILMLLSLVGYFAGPAPQVAPGLQMWTLVNRILASLALVGLAIVLRAVRPHDGPADDPFPHYPGRLSSAPRP